MNRIESSGTGITRWLLAALLVITAPTVLLAKGPGGGKGGKVSVEQADPPEAFQGEELDVVITGSGFDEGSTATWYVTGTDDGTQVEVLGSEYLPATGQLKAHIKVHGNASVNDYDIEVMNSGGRRGKGTTLFKVQSSETACTGSEDPSPSIAYLSASDNTNSADYYTADIMLASDSGCDTYLLLEDAFVEYIPSSPQQGTNEVLLNVSGLRFDFEAGVNPGEGLGVVTWGNLLGGTVLPVGIASQPFFFDGSNVVADPTGSGNIYEPASGWTGWRADIRVDDSGWFELVMAEKLSGTNESRLVYYHSGTDSSEVVADGACPVVDDSGACYQIDADNSLWNEDGSEIYATAIDVTSSPTRSVIVRIKRLNGAWQIPEVLMRNDNGLRVLGVRTDGLLSFKWWDREFRKNGKPGALRRYFAFIDPADCLAVECSPLDGFPISDSSSSLDPGLWTRDGGMLYPTFIGNTLSIMKYSNPLTGEDAVFNPFGPIDPYERDTSF